MAKLILFIAEQWILVAATLTCVFMLLYHESRRAGKTLSPQQVANLMNKENAVLIDLRDSSEFTAGHVIDAINIPHAKFAASVSDLEKYRDKPIVLTCKMGQHSSGAGKTLASKGFSPIYRMSGGMMDWQGQQFPVVKGRG